MIIAVCLVPILGILAKGSLPRTDAPWKTNTPIVTVHKELYRRHTKPREAPLASVNYVGPKFQKREVQMEEVESDVGNDVRARWSMDNGRTWSAFQKITPSTKLNVKRGAPSTKAKAPANTILLPACLCNFGSGRCSWPTCITTSPTAATRANGPHLVEATTTAL